jgi:hypothetical protein
MLHWQRVANAFWKVGQRASSTFQRVLKEAAPKNMPNCNLFAMPFFNFKNE